MKSKAVTGAPPRTAVAGLRGPLVAVLLLLGGCASTVLSGSYRTRGTAPSPSGGFVAGAARTDLTPAPGFPTAGHSRGGRIARGTWLRLYAQAIYLEDGRGQPLALVACDLWAIPNGLDDRVAELLGSPDETGAAPPPLGRDQLVLAATHTHHGPAGFASDRFFSAFSGAESGFDRQLFEHLAVRIAAAVRLAYTRREPARIELTSTRLGGLFRNRSFPAFAADPEHDGILCENEDLPLCEPTALYPDSRACRAIDPRVTVLRITPSARAGGPIALAAFLAVHPTVLPGRAALYGGDLFGAAARLAERRLVTAAGEPTVVVALFNGAEGDVSPQWRRRNREELLDLAAELAHAIVSPLATPRDVTGDIDSRLVDVGLAHGCFTRDGVRLCTTRLGVPGRPTLAGAEDGSSPYPRFFFAEGKRKLLALGPHGAKQPVLDLYLGPLPILPLTGPFMSVLRPPTSAPVAVHRLGPLRLVTLPGEFTTVLGRRIRATVAASAHLPVEDILLAGLAGGYSYYYATAEEYDRQEYEGSGTLYGRNAAGLIAASTEAMARALNDPAPAPAERSYRHRTGGKRSFGPGELRLAADRRDEGTEDVLGRGPLPQLCWTDALPDPGAESPGPRVSIWATRRGAAPGPLVRGGIAEDDDGLDFVTIAGPPSGPTLAWCAYWLRPSDLPADATCRFRVETVRDGARSPLWGEPFPCTAAAMAHDMSGAAAVEAPAR